MKTLKRTFFKLMIISLLVLSAFPASAAQTRKKLFNLAVTDNTGKKTYPVYEYKSDAGVSVGLDQSLSEVIVRGKKIGIAVSGRTRYFRNNYTAIKGKKSLTVQTTKKMTLSVTGVSGAVYKTKIPFRVDLKPEINEVTLSERPMSQGSIQNVTASVSVSDTVTCIMRVRNSSGKVVYKKTVGKGATGTFTAQWDGKPNKSLPAKATSDGYVAAGKYRLDIILQYKDGTKTKAVKKTVTFKVKKAETAAAAASPFKQGTWPWKVIMTGNKTVDYAAEVICQSVLKPNMTEIQRAKALYKWVGKNFRYNRGKEGYWATLASKMDVTSSSAVAAANAYSKYLSTAGAVKQTKDEYFRRKKLSVKRWNTWALNGLTKRTGDCMVIALSYAVLLRHAGIEADILEHLKEGQAGHHFWNVMNINGKWYMADADRPVEAGGNMLDYVFFLRGTKFMKTTSPYETLTDHPGYAALYAKMSAKDCPGR